MRLNFVVLFVLFSFGLSSQNLEVISFKEATGDKLDARIFKKIDKNGEACAIIKVNSKFRDLSFDSGYGITEVVYKKGEHWVYVSAKEQRLELWTEGYTKLKYNLPLNIKKLTIYELKLSADMIIEKVIKKKLPGFVYITSKPNGASVYIDGKPTGKITPFQKSLKQGAYQITLKKEMYADQDAGSVSIIESKTTKKYIVLDQPLFGTLSIKSNEGSEIYVDRQKMGTTQITEKLMAGSYFVEVKKSNFITQSYTLEVAKGKNTQKNITLIVKEGILQVMTEPAEAKIYLNERYIGESPMIKKQEVGSYVLSIKKDGYKTVTQNIVIKEEQQEDIIKTLKKGIRGGITHKGFTYGTIQYAGRTWLDRNIGATTVGGCGATPERDQKNWSAAKKACPSGYRLPTKDEFETLDKAIPSGERNAEGYKKYLKMKMCGYDGGSYNGTEGNYWSSTTNSDGSGAYILCFGSIYSHPGSVYCYKSSRSSIRCIKK